MADQKIQLTVQVNAETGQLEVLGAKLGETSSKAKDAANSFGNLTAQAGSLLRSMLPFATAAGVIAFFTDSVKGAEEQNEAFRRLQFTIEGTGKSWEANRKQVELWTNAVSNSTRFSDTDAITTLEKFTRVTGNLSQAQSASVLAMNLSVASGKDLGETMSLVTDLLNGNERALIGVKREFSNVAGSAKTTQEALDLLTRGYQNNAIGAEGLTDSSAKLRNAFGQFKDVVGNALIPALTVIIDKTTQAVQQFEKFGAVFASLWKSEVALFRGEFSKAIDELKNQMPAALDEIEQRKTASLAAGENERLIVTRAALDKRKHEEEQAQLDREQKLRENNQKISTMEAQLDREIASMKQQGLARDKSMFDAEVNARKIAIDKDIKGEKQKQEMLAKLRDFEKAGTQKLSIDQTKIKQEYALQVADLAIQTLQTLNSLGDTGSKAERTRAKALLLLQQSVAIGWAVVAAAKATAETANPAIGAALLAGQIALIAAQTAAGFQRIDQAANQEKSGLSGITVNQPVGGIDVGAGISIPNADKSTVPGVGTGTSPSGGTGRGGPSSSNVIFNGDIIIQGVNDASKIPDKVVDQIGERIVESIKGRGQTSFTGVL